MTDLEDLIRRVKLYELDPSELRMTYDTYERLQAILNSRVRDEWDRAKNVGLGLSFPKIDYTRPLWAQLPNPMHLIRVDETVEPGHVIETLLGPDTLQARMHAIGFYNRTPEMTERMRRHFSPAEREALNARDARDAAEGF